jgi:uncharacterized damage-inducible protein DinB
VAWVEDGLERWERALAEINDIEMERRYPLHWGAQASLGDIVVMVAQHVTYHTGELNLLLSIEGAKPGSTARRSRSTTSRRPATAFDPIG